MQVEDLSFTLDEGDIEQVTPFIAPPSLSPPCAIEGYMSQDHEKGAFGRIGVPLTATQSLRMKLEIFVNCGDSWHLAETH